jgi:pseudouridine-5'-phosphate glycosidase
MIRMTPEITAALASGVPLVALETTIVTHGMPYPQNVSTALSVEAIVREEGAVPATIAVIEGCIRIGLSAEELEWLVTAREVLKLSRADLPYALATGRHGATTVAATMLCAHLAGIGVFATGGIGGVHRGAEETMDVSADLEELAHTPVAVVCAGAKALLDIPKTLEVLETRGVPVVCYRCDEFPAFWSRSSGLPAPLRLDEPEAIARLIRTQRDLGLSGGTVIANPIPHADEIPAHEMNEHIESAVAEARRDGIRGKALTPFLLDRLTSNTAGRSLDANIALVKNNAQLAARIARALARA